MLQTVLYYDFLILDTIWHHLHCGFLDAVMPFFSMVGNYGLLWLVVALYLIARKKHRRGGVLLLSGLFLGFVLVNLTLKPLVGRLRPCHLRDVALLVTRPADYSFPSGHTMASFVSAFILLHYRRRFGLVAFPVAIFISFSRLYLYMHFPSDVLFSILLAAVVAFLVIKINKKKDCSE